MTESPNMKSSATDLRSGIRLTGKWHNGTYPLIRKLGSGAIGSVYLTERNGVQAALKISDKRTSITMEVNVLQSLKKVQGHFLGPCLLETDDYSSPSGKLYTFYVMEYIQGSRLDDYVKKKGSEWLPVLLLGLLEDLEHLHQAGWVFGDLKLDNLVVSDNPIRLRWVDVGGTTQIGRAIKEYTEFYDRGHWGMGSRKAEPTYDLFALAMTALEVIHGSRFNKGETPKVTLKKSLTRAGLLRPILEKALAGKYPSSIAMKQDMMKLLMKQNIPAAVSKQVPPARRSKRKTGIGECLLLSGYGFVCYVLYLLQ
ncbi:serine/threonine protein kinase [Terribacillus aidingensis]|uniref:Serine/threonine protein kinase n=1 Tax=Terribacillus aidingensis TaxID=586416 RepID=A0A285P8Y5_9BACI|nr:protein kinase family protein [Terribacillus aidingensis]SNZ18182.1 serine/threonine protein kinase [Terribacillus aidingensis]